MNIMHDECWWRTASRSGSREKAGKPYPSERDGRPSAFMSSMRGGRVSRLAPSATLGEYVRAPRSFDSISGVLAASRRMA